jgi:hypothetical protein
MMLSTPLQTQDGGFRVLADSALSLFGDSASTAEVFPCFVDNNGFSKRIAISHIEGLMHFPIDFVAPFRPGNPHGMNEKEVANVDATLKAIVKPHRAYRQADPDCFKRSRYRRPGP